MRKSIGTISLPRCVLAAFAQSNRELAAQRLDHVLNNGSAPFTGLLFCDLDGFKAVNDSLGHNAAGAKIFDDFVTNDGFIVHHQHMRRRRKGVSGIIRLGLVGDHQQYPARRGMPTAGSSQAHRDSLVTIITCLA